jgi:hypothetical protein
MSDLYNRDFAMNVGGVPIETRLPDPIQGDKIQPTLKVEFSIGKNSNKDPNTADITIYNLNEANRKILQVGFDNIDRWNQLRPPRIYDWPIVIEAGYVGRRKVIYKGDITFGGSRKEKVDWVTEIQCGDGEKKYRAKRMNQSFGPGTPLLSVISTAALLLDVEPGNLAEKLGVGVFRKGYGVFNQGLAVSGRASDIIDQYLTSAGFTWSIQDGQLQILAPNETTFEVVTLLNKETGLIGSPEKGDKGVVTFRSLLNPEISPGRRILIESDQVKGFFKVDRVNHFGDTWGSDWYSEGEGKPLGVLP